VQRREIVVHRRDDRPQQEAGEQKGEGVAHGGG
jgi:hypothetical protein